MTVNLIKPKSRSLRKKILVTVSLLSIVRLGTYVPVPGLDRNLFPKVLSNEASSNPAYAQILANFSGSGNTTSVSLLSLGIVPYINASIFVQLLTTTLPFFTKLQKEEGEYGRRQLTEATRLFSFFFAVVQSIQYTANLQSLIFPWSLWKGAQISLSLVCGSMILLWFSERITKEGLGNGSSLFICFNIVSSLPEQVSAYLLSLQGQSNRGTSLMALGLVFWLSTVSIIYLNEAIIRIPLVSAYQLSRKTKNESRMQPSLPLKVNQAGVMPLVFTSYALVVLTSWLRFFPSQWALSRFLPAAFLFWGGKLIFWMMYAGCIYFFTYFYSTVIIDPKDVSEQLRKSSVVIMGITPGNATKAYLSQALQHIAKVNAFFLIANIIGVQFLESVFGLNLTAIQGLGFSSQLILVNVLVDILKQVRGSFKEEKGQVLLATKSLGLFSNKDEKLV